MLLKVAICRRTFKYGICFRKNSLPRAWPTDASECNMAETAFNAFERKRRYHLRCFCFFTVCHPRVSAQHLRLWQEGSGRPGWVVDQVIISHQGTLIKSAFFTGVGSSLGCGPIAYHAASKRLLYPPVLNGLVEWWHRVLKAVIKCREKNLFDWIHFRQSCQGCVLLKWCSRNTYITRRLLSGVDNRQCNVSDFIMHAELTPN